MTYEFSKLEYVLPVLLIALGAIEASKYSWGSDDERL